MPGMEVPPNMLKDMCDRLTFRTNLFRSCGVQGGANYPKVLLIRYGTKFVIQNHRHMALWMHLLPK